MVEGVCVLFCLFVCMDMPHTLCPARLMNRIKPGCIPEETITWEGARSKQINIRNFLEQAETYGVPKAKLFHLEDLLHLRHIPRVTRCIYALAKLVSLKGRMAKGT